MGADHVPEVTRSVGLVLPEFIAPDGPKSNPMRIMALSAETFTLLHRTLQDPTCRKDASPPHDNIIDPVVDICFHHV
jgi:hypothetical protein